MRLRRSGDPEPTAMVDQRRPSPRSTDPVHVVVLTQRPDTCQDFRANGSFWTTLTSDRARSVTAEYTRSYRVPSLLVDDHHPIDRSGNDLSTCLDVVDQLDLRRHWPSRTSPNAVCTDSEAQITKSPIDQKVAPCGIDIPHRGTAKRSETCVFTPTGRCLCELSNVLDFFG